MFTHLYSPDEVKKITHEEIYKEEKKFKKDERLSDSDSDSDSDIVKMKQIM